MLGIAMMFTTVAAIDVSAHRRDELLQAARIDVAADRVELELSLTPGIAVADDVIGSIDRDGNGVLSADEQRDHAARVMAATELRIDGNVVKMAMGTAAYPTLDELRQGNRSIDVRSTAALPKLSSGRHAIGFANGYRGDISVYLANALKPDSERIVIASQHRDPEQRTLAIDFTIDGDRLAALPVWMFGSGAVAWIAFRRRLMPSRHES